MTTTPQTEAQTEAQRLAASISATLDSQDDSYLTCSVTKCLLQQAATELLRLDSLRLELQTQLADYKEACTKAETRADQAEGRAKLLACAWIKATDAVPQESDGEVFVRFSDGSIGTGWATYWHGSSNDFARWTFPDTDEFRMVSEWAKNVPASTGMHWTENEPVRLPASRAGRVYMAGPMTGLPELNFPAFNQEAERLRAEGLQVLNPADHGIVDGADWADYLRHDITGLASCERIHLLRGWTKSKGACLEMTIAKALGMTVTYQVDAEIEHNNAPAVPQGEPTEEMLVAGLKECEPLGELIDWREGFGRSEMRAVWEAMLAATPAPAPARGEPFGYFRAEPFGWTDCSEDAEGAIALYEHPAKPAQDVGLTDEVPAHVAGLLEHRRELDATEFFESTNRDSYEFKKSVRGIYVNPAVARDWKWFQLGMKHATEDES